MYFTAAFAASLPSVKEPDENLWAEPPIVSPAPNSPLTVVILLRSEERRVGKECRSLCDWSSDVCFPIFAASLPSVKEPDENLWAEPPIVSPAPNSPLTVVILLYPHLYCSGDISSGPLAHAPEQVA